MSRRQLRPSLLHKQTKPPRVATAAWGPRPPVPRRGEMQGLMRPVRQRPPSWDLGPEYNLNRLNPEVERERLEIIQQHKARAAQWSEQKDEELKLMQGLLHEIRTVGPYSSVWLGHDSSERSCKVGWCRCNNGKKRRRWKPSTKLKRKQTSSCQNPRKLLML
eukprot:559072-Rhodomonas_salina.2